MARPRKPTHLQLVTGTFRPDRRSKNEPKPQRARPSPPEHLSDRAKTAWGYVSALLERMGVLTEADGMALEGLCESYADVLTLRRSRDAREAPTYETINQSGGIMHRAYPEFAMLEAADRRFCMWLSKFGLTAADRSRVTAGEQRESNPFAELG